MADATPARSDAASRDEELRPAEMQETPITACARILGLLDEADDRAEKLGALKGIVYPSLRDGQFHLLRLIPENDTDLVLLSALAALLAEQLPNMIDQSDAHEVGLANGVFDALVAISGYLCARLRGGSDVIRAIYPELGRSIQRDVMTTNIRRADMEALRHGK